MSTRRLLLSLLTLACNVSAGEYSIDYIEPVERDEMGIRFVARVSRTDIGGMIDPDIAVVVWICRQDDHGQFVLAPHSPKTDWDQDSLTTSKRRSGRLIIDYPLESGADKNDYGVLVAVRKGPHLLAVRAVPSSLVNTFEYIWEKFQETKELEPAHPAEPSQSSGR